MRFSVPLFVSAVAVWSACGAAMAAEPRARVRGEVDSELRRQLERAIGDTDQAPSNRFEARRRARAGVEAAEALLRSEGYYQSALDDLVEGEDTPQAIVEVAPGQRFLIDNPSIRWSAPPPGAEAAAFAVSEMGLAVGAPGRAVDVIAAEGRVVAALVRRGYADARAEPRRVVVDHAAFTVQPEYRVASGQVVRLDGIRLETRGRTQADWVAGLAPWSEGDRYDPEALAELERRLLETGVYDGVGVALTPLDQTGDDGLRPVVVTLNDRPFRILEVGASFSTAEGSGADVIRTQHNRLGRADTLRYQARLADIDSRIGADLSLPHWRKPGRTLKLAGMVTHEDTDAYRRVAAVTSAELQQRLGRTSWFSYGLGLDAGQYTETRFDPITAAPLRLDRNLVILTGRAAAYLDRSNDPLNPTRGWRFNVSAQPTAVTGEDTVMFLRTEAQATGYLPLRDGGATVLAGRARLGAVIGGDELNTPSDRLFYSGGGGSVRGYDYQGVGPRLPDNTPRGGTSLFETSIEVRHDIGQRWGMVAFLDAGAVGFDETPDFSALRYGAGLGVRYRLPFGPVRADVAVPLDKRDGDPGYQIYISIGQAF